MTEHKPKLTDVVATQNAREEDLIAIAIAIAIALAVAIRPAASV